MALSYSVVIKSSGPSIHRRVGRAYNAFSGYFRQFSVDGPVSALLAHGQNFAVFGLKRTVLRALELNELNESPQKPALPNH
jgi:hypothetical protein